MDYASSGVDIEKESEAVKSLVGAITYEGRPAGSLGASVPLPGGFGGVIEFGDSCLVMATDGVGSKLQIANRLGRLEGVGVDCVAMSVNDLICVGAEPLAFVDYIAVPETDEETHAILGASLSVGCSRSRTTLAGGETATLPGIVKELDLSGTALGWFPRGMSITGDSLEDGDRLIGLPSSGIHSNGFSLVRAVLDRSGCSLLKPCPFDSSHNSREIERFPDSKGEVTLGEVILNPTRIYVDPVVDLFLEARGEGGVCNEEAIKGVAHITGGGLSNLLRLHDSLGWEISDPLPVQPEFEWIADVGGVSSLEMYRTFNMGMGMVIAVSSEDSAAIADWLGERLPGSRIVGTVTNEGRVVTHSNSEVCYTTY